MKPKLPHWADLVIGLLTVVIAWVTMVNKSGELPLPALAVTALTVVSTILTWLSSSAVPSQNAKAVAAAKLTGALLVLVVLGLLVTTPGDAGTRAQVMSVPQEDGTVAYLENMNQSCATSESVRETALVFAGQGCNGAISPVAVVDASLAALSCGVTVIGKDTMTSPVNWIALAIDLGETCGMEVKDIIQLFGEKSQVAQAAIQNAEPVHAASLRFRAKAHLAAVRGECK